MSGVVSVAYNLIAKRTSTSVLTLVLAAFVFERTYDMGIEAQWRNHNNHKMFPAVKAKYEALRAAGQEEE